MHQTIHRQHAMQHTPRGHRATQTKQANQLTTTSEALDYLLLVNHSHGSPSFMTFIKRIQNSIISNGKLDHSIYYYACFLWSVISDSVTLKKKYNIFHSIYIVSFPLDFSKLVVSNYVFAICFSTFYLSL